MANRSYLYTANKIPKKGELPDRIVGLSEWAWGIPLIYKILATRNPAVCQSAIWNEFETPVGIAARFDGGYTQVIRFFELLDCEDISDKEDFYRYKEAIPRFVLRFAEDFLLLEAGEIFEMEDVSFEDSLKALLEEIHTINEEIYYLLSLPPQPGRLQKSNLEEFRNLPSTWKSELCLENWSTILYYDFSHVYSPPAWQPTEPKFSPLPPQTPDQQTPGLSHK